MTAAPAMHRSAVIPIAFPLRTTAPVHFALLLLLLLWSSSSPPLASCASSTHHSSTTATTSRSSGIIVVVGSINADTFLVVEKLPREGENLVALQEPECDVPGGKGCTQAVAAQKLLQSSSSTTHPPVRFLGQFGSDAVADQLKQTLLDANVDIAPSGTCRTVGSGRGYVFLCQRTGQVSAVVSGGSNMDGWDEDTDNPWVLDGSVFDHCRYVMLQREIPEHINLRVARYCQQRGITVFQDVGGQERPMSTEMLQLCDYLIPNETELERLAKSFVDQNQQQHQSLDSVADMVMVLQNHGAKHLLVTQGSRGSTLFRSDGTVHHQPCYVVDRVVDETGAGDCYRAAFVVALSEGKSPAQAMEWASVAGACSVTCRGAVPSTPTRAQVEELLLHGHARNTHDVAQERVLNIPRGDGLRGGGGDGNQDDGFPFLIGSRLNSMKDRPELWDTPLLTPQHYVERQAQVKGLTCVDFNYPQHFHTWSSQEARQALDEAGLVAGAVCLRYPAKFARGAMNHPNEDLRREAIQLTKEAAQVALELGCREVVVWSAFDGYDYPLQVDYDTKWKELVDAFRECCDAFPDMKFSLEYKPTDENTRFFTVPSTGAALLLVNQVDRKNFGLTLDVGHMLMSGENPGQSIAMAGSKLFGIQLNDGYTRLAAEDGLIFGSVHPGMALEIMYQLRRIVFSGHFYFDTFPQRTDPIREAEYNIRQVKAFWRAAEKMDKSQLRKVMQSHDAVGALEMVNEALRNL